MDKECKDIQIRIKFREKNIMIVLIEQEMPSKIRKEGFRKVSNVWSKSHFGNFEVG